MIALHITDTSHVGQVRFDEPYIGQGRFDEPYIAQHPWDPDTSWEVIGFSYEIDNPRYHDGPSEPEDCHYWTVDPTGYPLTKKGKRRADARYPNSLSYDAMSYEDRKDLAKQIVTMLDIPDFNWGTP